MSHTYVEPFKGDALETKFTEAGEGVFLITEQSLDAFFQDGANCDLFLLMLYDDGRMPFSERIKREAFVSFVRKAFENFMFTGTFDSYIFILREIFGAESEILFEVPTPGKLSISVNAVSETPYEAIVRILSGNDYEFFNLATFDGDDLVFRGLAGIETEAELRLLFAEIMPAGIVPDIALNFFSKFIFIGEDGSGEFDVTDHDDNQIIFVEIGG